MGRRSRTASTFLVVAALALLGGAVVAGYEDDPTIATLLALTAACTVVVALRGPTRRSGRVGTGVLATVGALALLFVYLGVLVGSDDLDDVEGLLAHVTIGLVTIALCAWLVSTWSSSRYVEPVALLVTTLLLGTISFAGLHTLTAPIDYARTDGQATLYVSDPAVPLTWTVSAAADQVTSASGPSGFSTTLHWDRRSRWPSPCHAGVPCDGR